MVTIRLSRYGSKNSLFYRIVVVEKKRKQGGKPLDVIGFWNPTNDQKELKLDKLKSWVEKGASVTKAVEALVQKK
ncbi:30S ribosomal protein S16 [Candidatus Woesebacteria bacterium RIFCSPHIGHO2_01_FULL_38_9]|uniref:Small ribosomal subunit protein bS16 n=2 Tax=Candidatus Woeseibacteriota TaxID=1752722 RepID=A0A1F7Y309_9BACT|nr:MAG: 30S ribosomal protein S16 [Candidatus Woesebacteria bacterium RIFCSPHIGHO2_01_FULL_38_9]OGM58565.1 MAG: 30S ribosomal protein S16 [Candidatus Woesebacteria bacterium RIFCSPLOWO2_01_FULL_39_10]